MDPLDSVKLSESHSKCIVRIPGDGAGGLIRWSIALAEANLGHQIGVTVGEAANPRKTIPAGRHVLQPPPCISTNTVSSPSY